MTRSRDQKCSHINCINIQNNQERYRDLKDFFDLNMWRRFNTWSNAQLLACLSMYSIC